MSWVEKSRKDESERDRGSFWILGWEATLLSPLGRKTLIPFHITLKGQGGPN